MTWWKDKKYDLTGQIFGKLTVKSLIEGIGRRRWLCICICGNTTEVAANNLKKGQVISCGCALKGCNNKKPYEWLYNKLVYGAKLRNYAITISYEDYLEFTKELRCHYCYSDIIWQPHSTFRIFNNGAHHTDRKDNDIGYTKENCVVCCSRCNWSKADQYTYEEWYGMTEYFRRFNAS